jgi:hypothetical protein
MGRTARVDEKPKDLSLKNPLMIQQQNRAERD